MTRYSPSRAYITGSIIAVVFGTISCWFALNWTPALIAVVLFLLSSAALLFLALRPPIEIHRDFLLVGQRRILWREIKQVDRTLWISPLVVCLGLFGGHRLVLIYPGDPHSAGRLLRQIRRLSTRATIDGLSYSEFWDEEPAPKSLRDLPSPTYRLLRHEDEEEVERLYQRLKAVGHIDPSNSNDEN